MYYEVGGKITLEDNKSYIIVDYFEITDNKYLYLINEESKKASLVKIINDSLYEINDDNEYNNVLNELFNRNKDKITKLLEETNK